MGFPFRSPMGVLSRGVGADVAANATEDAGTFSIDVLVRIYKSTVVGVGPFVLFRTPVITKIVIPSEGLKYLLATIFGEPSFAFAQLHSQERRNIDWPTEPDVSDTFTDQSTGLILSLDRGSQPIPTGTNSAFPAGTPANPEWFAISETFPAHTNPTVPATGTAPYEILFNSFSVVGIPSAATPREYYGTAFWRDRTIGDPVMLCMVKWRETILSTGFSERYLIHTELRLNL